MRLVLGSDILVLRDAVRPAAAEPGAAAIAAGAEKPSRVSVAFRDARLGPLSRAEALDLYVENAASNVPELVLCHVEAPSFSGAPPVGAGKPPGGVGVERIATEDIAALSRDPFSPYAAEASAASLLTFLQTHCARECGTYWLVRRPGDSLLRLYDMSGPAEQPASRSRWRYVLGMLCVRLARRAALRAADLEAKAAALAAAREATGVVASDAGGRPRPGASTLDAEGATAPGTEGAGPVVESAQPGPCSEAEEASLTQAAGRALRTRRVLLVTASRVLAQAAADAVTASGAPPPVRRGAPSAPETPRRVDASPSPTSSLALILATVAEHTADAFSARAEELLRAEAAAAAPKRAPQPAVPTAAASRPGQAGASGRAKAVHKGSASGGSGDGASLELALAPTGAAASVPGGSSGEGGGGGDGGRLGEGVSDEPGLDAAHERLVEWDESLTAVGCLNVAARALLEGMGHWEEVRVRAEEASAASAATSAARAGAGDGPAGGDRAQGGDSCGGDDSDSDGSDATGSMAVVAAGAQDGLSERTVEIACRLADTMLAEGRGRLTLMLIEDALSVRASVAEARSEGCDDCSADEAVVRAIALSPRLTARVLLAVGEAAFPGETASAHRASSAAFADQAGALRPLTAALVELRSAWQAWFVWLATLWPGLRPS
ncbi:hypothetical protein FNF27_00626 [Cafeteria roenbergensis]|uniref:EDRF1 N-terminal domain-containing protein n=1 Tax=Cafeteria roenbergensis TaxID=33653 RepID=A0A5A8ELU3_CAFRO|nr:hypothetical protein FNF27_00626 [Cafeteria roenbergensis]